MFYGVIRLTNKLGTNNDVFKHIQNSASKGQFGGRLKGCWYSEIGSLNKILLLHYYESHQDIINDRIKFLEGGNPLGLVDLVTDIEFSSYKAFPGVEEMPFGDFGPFYEVRRYDIKADGLPPTLQAWDKVRTARSKLSPLMTVMYALEGSVPHFVHIWPYRTLEERSTIRARAVEEGVWPPPGGPPYLLKMHSDIYLPAPFSPAR